MAATTTTPRHPAVPGFPWSSRLQEGCQRHIKHRHRGTGRAASRIRAPLPGHRRPHCHLPAPSPGARLRCGFQCNALACLATGKARGSTVRRGGHEPSPASPWLPCALRGWPSGPWPVLRSEAKSWALEATELFIRGFGVGKVAAMGLDLLVVAEPVARKPLPSRASYVILRTLSFFAPRT